MNPSADPELIGDSSSSPYPFLELEERSAISSSALSENPNSPMSSPPRGDALSTSNSSQVHRQQQQQSIGTAGDGQDDNNSQPSDEASANSNVQKQLGKSTGNVTDCISSQLKYDLFSDEENQDIVDSTEQIASYAIYGSLVVFGVLVIASIILAVRIIQQQYGFVAVFLITLIVGFWVGLITLVKHLLQEEERLQPVRSKLQQMAHHVKALIKEEYDAFRAEYSEYTLLLKNGEEEEDGTATPMNANGQTSYVAANGDDDGLAPPSATSPSGAASPTKKKRKSVVFRMVKPFLKVRNTVAKKGFFRKKNKGNTTNDQQQEQQLVELQNQAPPPSKVRQQQHSQSPQHVTRNFGNNRDINSMYLPPQTKASYDGGVSV